MVPESSENTSLATPPDQPVAPVKEPLPATNKSQRLNPLLIVISLVLLVVVIILFSRGLGGVHLTKFTTNGFSVLVPADYVKASNGGTSEFTEKLRKGENVTTQSRVIVDFEPSDFTPALRQAILDGLQKQSQNSLALSIVNTGKLQNFKTSKVKVSGFEGFKAQGTSVDLKNNKTGQVNAIVVVGSHGIYQIVVYAHKSDPDLAKSANKIINSLSIN